MTSELGPNTGAIVDDREHALSAALAVRHPRLNVKRVRLLLGDVQVVQDGRIALVLERKTRSDLRASLIDGRFASQRARLVREFGHDRCGFVVEGGTSWTESESGAEIALVIRDRIAVFWSGGVDDTADLIARLAKANLAARASPPRTTASQAPAISPAAAASSRACVCMLQCVAGVSSRRAHAICALYPSMCALAEAVGRDREGTIRAIGDLTDGRSARRLGRTVSARIVACVAGEDVPTARDTTSAAGDSGGRGDGIMFTALD